MLQAVVVGAGGWAYTGLPVPTPAPHEVLVRVHAVGLNRADLDERDGRYRGKAHDPALPNVAGAELAGAVEWVGGEVTGVVPGDRVMAMVNGAFAEYAVVDARLLLPVPAALTWTAAAALPVACLTEHDALVARAGLRPGDSVLVLGATSGVGVFAAALARELGAATVLGTSRSAAKLKLVPGLDVAIDTSTTDLADAVLESTGGAGADVVVDHVGGELTDRAIAATRVGGTVVQVGRLAGDRALLDLGRLAYRRVRLVGTTFRTRTSAEHAEVVAGVRADVLPLVGSGRLGVPVDRVFAFTDLDAAYAYVTSGSSVGKVVLTLGDE
ncbi:MAG: zinc-binding dehydrogenase [Streptosporangiales bacterium]|nr:zinc-binding dehydrogenase [Streptosporangiales bacterium]